MESKLKEAEIYQLIDTYKKCPYNESILSLLLREGKRVIESNHDKNNKVKR